MFQYTIYRKEKKGRSAGELQHPYSQTQYRQQSSSKYKYKKVASHILPLDRAMAIQSSSYGLQSFINKKTNYRKVDMETSRSIHPTLDSSIQRKIETSKVLTKAEEKRARQQVKFIQKNKDDCPPGFYEAAKKDFKSAKTKDGKTLWDSRHDKRSKKRTLK